jgi:colanic acid/amylovoran biosynthesis glycosyltransferase
MGKKNTVIFKISEFPHTSETFIINQIITAVELGYDVYILVHKVLDFSKSLHRDLLFDYKLEQKIIYNKVLIPKNYVLKLAKIIYLLLKNFTRIIDIYNFYKYQPNKSISWIYYWDFYNSLDSDDTIFHIQYGNNKYPFDILKAKCNFKSKVIITFHGHDAFFPMHGYISNNNYYGLLFEGVDIVTSNTRYLADKIIELGCPTEKIKIIPVAVDTDYFNCKTEETNRYSNLRLINVGRLDPIKGQKYLLEIIRKLTEKGVDVNLNIIGEGEERVNLEKLILKYNLKNSVTLLGKKSQEEIRQFFLESDLYIFTAVPVEDGRRETQGLATLEAQACGLPVIAYDSGGIKYTVKQNVTGFIFNEFEIDQIVDKLLFLNQNRNIITDLSLNCRNFVLNEFSQRKINLVWKDVYKN